MCIIVQWKHVISVMRTCTAQQVEEAVRPVRSELIDMARRRKSQIQMEPLPTGVEPSFTELPDIRAVLFDVYGTLLISPAGEVGTAEESTDVLREEGPRGPGTFSAVDRKSVV